MRPALKNVAVATVLLFLPVFTLSARAEDCPSAEACLSDSFERSWSQYHDVIEGAWADKKEIAGMLERARAVGNADLIAQLEAEETKANKRWEFAEAVARALTAPHFKDFVASERDKAAKAYSDASERVQKETELYRRLLNTTVGPERESVIKDISSYQREAEELRKTFFRDGFMVSMDAAAKSAGLVADGWTNLSRVLTEHGLVAGTAMATTVPYVKAVKAVTIASHAGAKAVAAGMKVAEAERKDQDLKAMLEAAKGAAGGVLRTAELLAKAPNTPLKQAIMREGFGKIASKGIYANVLALGLDTVLTLAAVSRLKDAEARQLDVETNDVKWRARVETAGRLAGDARAREERANRQVEKQRSIVELYAKIQAEAGQ